MKCTATSRALSWGGVLFLAIAATGCVSKTRFDLMVAERERLLSAQHQLRERLTRAELSNQSLSAERIELLEANDDLLEKQHTLRASVAELESQRARLVVDLSAAERERAKLAEVGTTYQGLVEELEAELASGQIQIEQFRDGLRVALSEQILFPSGSARLSEQGTAVLARVAERLTGQPYRIEVQGHTDNVPILGGLTQRYPTNWELAGARAVRVVRLFETRGLEPTLLSAVSLGEHHPVAGNETPEGRAENRRVEIRLRPVATAKPEES